MRRMTPVRVSGTELAEEILAGIAERHVPTTRELVGFVAASDPAGVSFQERKRRAAARAGIAYRVAALPEGVTHPEAASLIGAAAADPGVGGIVVQLPLPAQLDTAALLGLVPPGKDPDVLGGAAGRWLVLDDGPVLPPAARATDIILRERGLGLAGKTVAVIGMGRLVGRPVAAWLETQDATVLRLDKGFDEAQLADADLGVLGTGSYVLDPRLLKEGAGVIDFGYRGTENGPAGDLDASDEAALARLSFYTPTPGGTGPVLIAALLENFARLSGKTLE